MASRDTSIRWRRSQRERTHFMGRAKGSRFWDVDGNEYIDYLCAYGPMILGYDNEVIEQAVRDQLSKADTCSLASPVMVDLAETFVDLIPWADWATFAKNGADATNMAVLIARTHTGRRKLIAIEGGYHGSSPWMQARGRAGISERDHQELIRIPWNDLPALQSALLEHPEEIAAFISSPYHHPVYEDNALPDPGYWEGVLTCCASIGCCQSVMTCERVFACIWKVRPLTLATRRTSVATARRSPMVIRLQLWSGAANSRMRRPAFFRPAASGFQPDPWRQRWLAYGS